MLLLFNLVQVNKLLAQSKTNDKTLTKPLQNSLFVASADSNLKTLALPNDTSVKTKLVNKIDTLNVSKDSLDGPVKYKAQDSGVLIMATREFFLYGKSNVVYNTMNLDAGTIQYNGSKQSVKAFGAADTINNPLAKAKMHDGENTTYADTLEYSFKSQKGRTVNAYYTEGELFVNAQVLKKVDSNSFYGYRARFTTCNLDTPHFAFRTKKMKMVSNKLAVSGPAFPEFEGVPMPIGIPFGIYPMQRGRHSGILAPQFTTTEDMGIGLQGLGYYKVFSDYFDVLTKADFYSYGGWTLNVQPKYIKRYKYQGGLSITIMQNKIVNRSTASKDEFTQTKDFQVRWNHVMDNKARPGVNFQANVDFSSTQFNRNNIGNTISNFRNQTTSSISYSKTFNQRNNLSVNLGHNQNAVTRLVNLTLPTIAYSMQTIYPFQPKETVGKTKWYHNIGIGYSTNFSNSISYYDSAASFQKLVDTMHWRASHNLPISVALPALGPLIFTPGVSYSEEWYDRKYDLQWNDATKKIDTSISKAFIRDYRTSFSLALNTRIFGTYIFKNSKNIKALRHEIQPSISYSYTPNTTERNFYYIQKDTTKALALINKFTGNQAYNTPAQSGLSFNLNNSFELKVKNKQDTAAEATKKIRLFDLAASANYNLKADSFALSTIGLRLSSNAIPNVNFGANATLDPYVYDSAGKQKDKYAWQQTRYSIGKLMNGSITVGTQLKSKPIDDKKAKQTNQNDPFMTLDEAQRQLEYARSNPAEFTDFNIPWTVSLNYSFNFSKQFDKSIKDFKTTTSSNLSITGDFNLSPKWKMGGNAYYNLTARKIESLTFFVSREMHCWQMSINVTPVNYWRSFSISISPKSGLLRDLKVNRTRQFSNQ